MVKGLLLLFWILGCAHCKCIVHISLMFTVLDSMLKIVYILKAYYYYEPKWNRTHLSNRIHLWKQIPFPNSFRVVEWSANYATLVQPRRYSSNKEAINQFRGDLNGNVGATPSGLMRLRKIFIEKDKGEGIPVWISHNHMTWSWLKRSSKIRLLIRWHFKVERMQLNYKFLLKRNTDIIVILTVKLYNGGG